MTPRDVPMTEAQARQLAQDYRQEFRNSEAFEAAWQTLYELKTAISLPLARRILGEELLKFRTRQAGLEAATFLSSGPVPTPPPEPPFQCPTCTKSMGPWQRDGHAEWCPHTGLYALEVRSRIGIERRNIERAEERKRLREQTSAIPQPPPHDEPGQTDGQHPANEQSDRQRVPVHAGHPL